MTTVFILLLSLNIGLANQSTAQEPISLAKTTISKSADKTTKAPPPFVFNGFSRGYELSRITDEMAGNHFFGEDIAKKVYLLDDLYTAEVAVVPGNPQTKTVIKKPVIYTSVKRIEKYFAKSVKKGEISKESAIEEYNRVLDVALSILNEDTRQFEAEIEALHGEAAKIDLFTRRVNLRY
jgi:hypothetical protein